MIPFAAVFLLKITVKGLSSGVPGCCSRQISIASAGLSIDVPYIRNLVERIVELMVSCSKCASERYLSHHIARGLEKMLAGCQEEKL